MYQLREVAADWLMPIGLHLLGLLRRPIRFGTIRSLVSYKASKQAWMRSIRIMRGSACGAGRLWTRPDRVNVSQIITIKRMHESTMHLTVEEITPVHGAI